MSRGAHPWAALVAVGLAASGMALAAAGERAGWWWLHSVVGPGVTVLGAALWVACRARRGRGRERPGTSGAGPRAGR